MKYLSSYPDLVKEWHPTKNGDLTPENVTYGSKKKIWWLCSQGHSYDSMPNSRTSRNTKCPYCSGARVGEDNNLLAMFPKIAKEWHPTKNKDLTYRDVSYGSSKKVWWLCLKGHNYYSTISNRTAKNGTRCPECSGNKIGEDNNLGILFPEIASEWHPTKNGNLTPKDVTHGTRRKVWWFCPKGHDYEAVINHRTGMNTKCPYCSGRRVGEDNNLLFVFPEIAKDWHPSKNGRLTSNDVTSKSDKKVWWLCSKGHSYQSIIKNRTLNNSLCPQCSNQSSEPEIRILSEMKLFFDEVFSRYKVDGVEIDIYIPKFNLGIEYDGKYWHKENEELDLKKNKFLLSHDINLIRVREHPLKSLSSKDIVLHFNRSLEKKHIDEILKIIYSFVDNDTKEKINAYYLKSSFVNDELFKTYRSYFPSPFPEKSLLSTHPLIAKQWDYDKNYPLKPENFSFGSGKKMWWICPNRHSYEATLNHRTSNNGCPYCSGRKTLNYDLFK